MAGSDFQSFIDEVVMRNDIVDIISEYTTLKRTGNNMMGLCPLHNDKSLRLCRSRLINRCFIALAAAQEETLFISYRRR